MNTLILSVLAGMNLAFSLLSLNIWQKNKMQKVYFYFAIFSFFSALYILARNTSELLSFRIDGIVIFSAAMYYGVFPWFIFEYVKIKQKRIPKILSIVFLFAFLLFFINISVFNFQLWGIVAHIGSIGLIFVSLKGCIVLKNDIHRNSFYFQVIVILFTFLILEEIITVYSGTKFLSNYISGIMPLDLFPFIFSLIIGQKLATDLLRKSELEIELTKTKLKRNELKISNLEKQVLVKKLDFKNQDLAFFGIKLANNIEFVKDTLQKLLTFKKQYNIKNSDFDETILNIKSQLIIDKRQDLLYQKIETINHEFFNNIKSKHPNLTQNELNLVSLLKLKLSTKEIATIKNISPDSVKVLRYRLRKKLNIPTTTNLTEFLTSLN